tara:strand:+ start:610 stop:1020 length:411 start_codon:yes stop_codon:yes gene_type:complete
MLTEHEGKRNHAYQIDGKWHIGIGRNVDSGGLGLSDEECDYLLDNDIVLYMREVANAFPWYNSMDETRQDVLVMMAFNLGLPRLRGFKLALAAMEAGDYEESARQMLDSLWSRQLPERSAILAEMMRTGEYPDGTS